VARYRQELGLKAVLAVKQVNTTIPIKAHKKYSYKLQGLNISHARATVFKLTLKPSSSSC
jgi:putative transposase